MNDHAGDQLEEIERALAGLEERPVAEHVGVLGRSLDAIVAELDGLARSIPTIRHDQG